MMAFGFVIERFGLFLKLYGKEELTIFEHHISFIVGVAFILLAAFLSMYSIIQYRRVLKTLNPSEIPLGYSVRAGILANGIIALLGILLSVYLFIGFL